MEMEEECTVLLVSRECVHSSIRRFPGSFRVHSFVCKFNSSMLFALLCIYWFNRNCHGLAFPIPCFPLNLSFLRENISVWSTKSIRELSIVRFVRYICNKRIFYLPARCIQHSFIEMSASPRGVNELRLWEILNQNFVHLWCKPYRG